MFTNICENSKHTSSITTTKVYKTHFSNNSYNNNVPLCSECSHPNLPEVCQQDSRSIDCTRWNSGLVSTLLDAEEVNNFFPNINQEIIETSSDQTCRDVVKDILEVAFTSDNPYSQDFDADTAGCYTDCTATLITSEKCELSVFLLEKVDVQRVRDLNPANINIPEECGSYNITCCTEVVPQECISAGADADQSTGGGDMLAAIVGGVVGSVVGLAALIIMAVVIGVVAMVCSRRRKRTKQEM